MDADRAKRLQDFVDWTKNYITGDEKGQAQIFLDHLFEAFGRGGSLNVGGKPEFRIKKSDEDGGGTSFADYVWKPVVLIEMKKRGTDLARHTQQALDYWFRLVPNRPEFVVLCNFDEFRIYDFNVDINDPRTTLALGAHYRPNGANKETGVVAPLPRPNGATQPQPRAAPWETGIPNTYKP